MNKIVLLALLSCVNAFNLMTFNVKNGHTMSGEDDIAGTAATIKAQNPVVCGMQELDVNTERNPEDQPAIIAEKSGLTYHHFHKTIPYHGGAYGVGIISKVKPCAYAEFSLHDPTSGATPTCDSEDAYCRGVDAVKVELVPQHFIWYLSTHIAQSEALESSKQIVEECLTTPSSLLVISIRDPLLRPTNTLLVMVASLICGLSVVLVTVTPAPLTILTRDSTTSSRDLWLTIAQASKSSAPMLLTIFLLLSLSLTSKVNLLSHYFLFFTLSVFSFVKWSTTG